MISSIANNAAIARLRHPIGNIFFDDVGAFTHRVYFFEIAGRPVNGLA